MEDLIFEPDMEAGENIPVKDPLRQIKKLKTDLNKCLAEKKEYLDGWQRMKADMINYKKEEEKNHRERTEYANQKLLLEFLKVEESFQMAFVDKENWLKVDEGWRKGVEYIHSQFLDVLNRHHLTVINPLGEKFNPAAHHSAGVVHTDNPANDDIILEVLKKGYKLHEKVIKPAEVTVGVFEKKD